LVTTRQDASDESSGTPPDQIMGATVPPSDELSAAELRARATRVRRLARDFEHDEAAPRLRALADELDKRADALEAAAQDDE